VFCLDDRVAGWARQPIRLGVGTSHVAPLSVRPADVAGACESGGDYAGELHRVIEEFSGDAAQAHRARLRREIDGLDSQNRLVLATLIYAGRPDDPAARHALADAYSTLRRNNPGEAGVYADFIASVVHGEPRRLLEEDMLQTDGFVFESDIGQRAQAEGMAEGRARGMAEALLRILARRGLIVGAGERERVVACTDLDTLDAWVDRALTAQSIKEVLD
jgi:hypothetical protein